MKYFGGKARIGLQIANVINRFDDCTYWEPFCGMFSVGKHVNMYRYASDAHPDLIMLLKAVRDGWEPPEALTEVHYNELKTMSPSPLRAFAGFGCSNSGKFFGGYARDKTGRNYALNARNSLLRLRPLIQGVEFACHEYTYGVDADIIYCDPPYSNTTGFSVGSFDSEAFWDWVVFRSRRSIVLVSEYTAPEGFVPIWQKGVRTDMNNSNSQKIARVEKLFVHERLTRHFPGIE